MVRLYIIVFLLLIGWSSLNGQDPLRFQDEVSKMMIDGDLPSGDDIYLFTGSSSVRIWNSLSSDYPGQPVLNRGFGGSTMSDLLHFQEDLIFKYNPVKVFIYEGDNDISMEKSVETILEEARELVGNIKRRLPGTKIYFISPKPSVARWELREEYKHFNYSLSSWTSFEDNVYFIDVWTPMCDENGEVMKDIFLKDNLHMNAKGYKIWAAILRPFVTESN